MNKRLTFLAAVMLMACLMAATSFAFAQPAVTQQRQNPFLSPYQTPHKTVPFDKIRFGANQLYNQVRISVDVSGAFS